MIDAPNASTSREEFTVRGNRVFKRVREVIAAGNVRQITIRRDGRIIAELSLTVGVVGTALAPQVVFLGAVAALATRCSIEVVRVDQPLRSSQ